MDPTWFQNSKDVDWLKQQYFNDENKTISLKKGEVLLEPDSDNDRLFLIIKGRLNGYIGREGSQYEIFSSSKDMFIGVFSFFSPEHKSYSTVIAQEDSTLKYIERKQPVVKEAEFAQHFLPVVVNEIYLRQLIASELSLEREQAIKRLADSENMRTLGQLAAGTAHELNNALGVVHRNTEWLSRGLRSYFMEHEPGIFNFFRNSIEKGQKHSSNKVRERRKEIEKQYNLSPVMAKKLAKSNVDNEEIDMLIKLGMNKFKEIQFMIDAGLALHDMGVAANQAAHVVKSIRELGSTHKVDLFNTSITETINEALALTKNILRDINLQFDHDKDFNILAHRGDLVQVWINLIKNASESLSNAKTEDPSIHIKLDDAGSKFLVVISDNGPGIEKDLLPKIFQPNVTTKVSGLSFGFGLGLSIVNKIIDSYRGQVSVNSRPGNTEFIVQLPKT
jgi:signal transduction histidine kinase